MGILTFSEVRTPLLCLLDATTQLSDGHHYVGSVNVFDAPHGSGRKFDAKGVLQYVGEFHHGQQVSVVNAGDFSQLVYFLRAIFRAEGSGKGSKGEANPVVRGVSPPRWLEQSK